MEGMNKRTRELEDLAARYGFTVSLGRRHFVLEHPRVGKMSVAQSPRGQGHLQRCESRMRAALRRADIGLA